MKTQLTQRCRLASTLLFITALAPVAFGQGALTPSGAPAPTMKTLTQVEPRTIITNLPRVIAASGSYYLAGNLTGPPGADGIIVQADHVTIDLRGFALLGGGGGGGRGIVVSNSHVNLRVHNGSIANWPAQGVLADNASNSQFEHLRLSGNGSAGLQAGAGCTVSACVSERNQGDGISTSMECVIERCAASVNANGFNLQGVSCRISDSVASSNNACGIFVNGVGCSLGGCVATMNELDGINVGSGCRIDVCTTLINRRHGMLALDGCTIKNCTSNGNGWNQLGDGINVSFFCWVNGNTVNGNAGAGVRVSGGDCRIDDNSVNANAMVGIICNPAINCFVTRNTAHNNGGGGADYNFAPGNKDAAVVAHPNAGGPWSNFSY